MSIRDRKEKVRKLVPHCKPVFTIEGRPTAYHIISESGKRYHVSLTDKPQKIDNGQTSYFEYKATCRDITSPSEALNCRGNDKVEGRKIQTVCYHCLACLIERAERLGWEVSICDNTWDKKKAKYTGYDNAIRLNQMIDGCIIKLVSSQSGGIVWLVGKKVRKNEPSLVGIEKGIELLRGNKDETID